MISFENMGEELLNVVPHLRKQYVDELEWWGSEKPGPHIIYGDLLTPYLINLLQGGRHKDELSRVFAFLEDLAGHDDIKVQEVVAFSVIEGLLSHEALLQEAQRYMGPRLLQFVDEVREFWLGS